MSSFDNSNSGFSNFGSNKYVSGTKEFLESNSIVAKFAFLLLVMIILAIMCAEISIVYVYIMLCNGNYKWHEKSFLIPGSAAIYMFSYSIIYFYT